MVDRIDLLIAVAGIVVSVLGSSTALWMAISKKADREDLVRLETRLDHRIDRLETKFDALDVKMQSGFNRLDAKIDALILRLVPDQLPRPES